MCRRVAFPARERVWRRVPLPTAAGMRRAEGVPPVTPGGGGSGKSADMSTMDLSKNVPSGVPAGRGQRSAPRRAQARSRNEFGTGRRGGERGEEPSGKHQRRSWLVARRPPTRPGQRRAWGLPRRSGTLHLVLPSPGHPWCRSPGWATTAAAALDSECRRGDPVALADGDQPRGCDYQYLSIPGLGQGIFR